ncbi:MAG: wax ester/triacylglycerol synthase family O-acyltransferase [Acidimicrobiales bacterium]
MRRLSGEDAGFLSMELPEQPMNTMAVAVLRSDGPPLTLADVRRHLQGRLPQLPSFRWRIVRVPFGLHHPVCVDDPDFDLDFHLRSAVLEGAGDDAELDALFARIAERHLDRRHPLWQVTLVDGLQGGRQALILKYHHCLADGVAAFTTFSRVFSDAELPALPGVGPFAPTRLPRRGHLVVDAVADHARSLRGLPALIGRTRRGTAALKARRAAAAVAVPDFKGDAPWCELNDAFSVDRAYARVALPLDGVKAIKDRAGVTLNDVVLAIVAGALRTYLADRGGLPERPLLASVPVSFEAPDAPTRQSGNRFWSFTTSLATDVDDPAERLAAIGARAAEAKAQLSALGVDLVPAWLEHVPPFVADPGARALVERLRAEREAVDVNVLVSNIRGPAEPWHLLGATVDDLYIDGPPSNGVGLNVMLWSYGDRLLFGVLAFADALRDPPALEAAFRSAYEALLPT